MIYPGRLAKSPPRAWLSFGVLQKRRSNEQILQVNPAGVMRRPANLQLQVEFFTTDTSAGPGSLPGPTQGTAPVILPTASPTPTESPSPESPSPTESPSATPGG